tara:strand:+ start:2197 stop:2700 length:504 start_codon:yes stop_codon:yes gene_type:complete
MEGGLQRDGFKPDFFGTPLWFSIHVYSLSFPISDTPKAIDMKKRFKTLFEHMLICLPCEDCLVSVESQNMLKHIRSTDFTTLSRKDVVDMFFDFHNNVNKKLGKHILTQTELEAMLTVFETGRVGKDQKGRDLTKDCGKSIIKIQHPSSIQSRGKLSSIFIDKKCLK